jgi:hypothetical protein
MIRTVVIQGYRDRCAMVSASSRRSDGRTWRANKPTLIQRQWLHPSASLSAARCTLVIHQNVAHDSSGSAEEVCPVLPVYPVLIDHLDMPR